MLLKLLGTLILIIAGGYVSLTVSRFERRRLDVLDGYISLIYYIKGQIDCYAMPLPDIIARADPALLAACLGVDPNQPIPAAPLPTLLQESRLYLDPESERLLTSFTGELGTTHRTEQVARCDHYIQALTAERQKLHTTLPARLRTSATLTLACTLCLAILLW